MDVMTASNRLQMIGLWIKHFLAHWVFEVDTTSVELFSAVEAVLLGAFFLSPLPTYASSVTFNLASQIAPESTWGMIFFLVGLGQFIALIVDNEDWRKTFSLVSMTLFGVWAATLIISNVASTATVTYPLIALSMLWAHVSLEARD